jgi:hypothetical protein
VILRKPSGARGSAPQVVVIAGTHFAFKAPSARVGRTVAPDPAICGKSHYKRANLWHNVAEISERKQPSRPATGVSPRAASVSRQDGFVCEPPHTLRSEDERE